MARAREYCNARERNLNCRYIAVTQPIKYAKHKNNKRVWVTIGIVWVISAAIGSPIVLGLNNTSDRIPDQCLFYNTDFIIYSSLSSFYIPCIIMVFLYYNIFKVRTIPATAHLSPYYASPSLLARTSLNAISIQWLTVFNDIRTWWWWYLIFSVLENF